MGKLETMYFSKTFFQNFILHFSNSKSIELKFLLELDKPDNNFPEPKLTPSQI